MEITDKNFDEIIANNTVVLVDFWATWCGPCRMLTPIIEELAQEYDGKAVVSKLNVDDNTEVTEKFGIMSIPTLLFFKNGNLADKIVGAGGKGAIKEKLDSLLA